MCWRILTRNIDRKRLEHFVLPGLAISGSYVSTFLLPRDDWPSIFLTAVPFLVIANILGALVLGGLLERHLSVTRAVLPSLRMEPWLDRVRTSPRDRNA